MQIYDNPSSSTIQELIRRPELDVKHLKETINGVFEEVKAKGDSALKEFTEKFDKISLDEMQVTKAEIMEAKKQVPLSLQEAIVNAFQNILRFHQKQLTKVVKVETQTGVTCWQKTVAIEKVGLYIPGGTAPLFSTVLMLCLLYTSDAADE